MQKNWRSKWGAKGLFFIHLHFLAFVALGQLPSKVAADFQKGIGPEGSISALLVNIDSGDTLLSIRHQSRLVPASVLKLVTTSAALELLGADYNYRTKVAVSGNIEGGVLHGDLCIVGGADPTIGSSILPLANDKYHFDAIKAIIQKSGIRTINGNILVDASFFPDLLPPPGRIWEDVGNYYGALPSGMNYRDNTFSLFLSSPNRPNAPCSIVATEPVLHNIRFECKVKSSQKSMDSAYVYGLNSMPVWTVEGSIPMGQSRFKIKGALPNPPQYFASDLRHFLMANGIDVKGKAVAAPSTTNIKLAEIGMLESVALAEIVSYININSNNLLADNLFLTIGKEVGGSGDWDTAQKVLARFWNEKSKNGKAIGICDGSGLSPNNKISALALVDVLGYMDRSLNAKAFKQSLAVGGKSGTLKNMWAKPETAGKVLAKSGSLKGVVAYSGYFQNAAGQTCAFAVIVNNSLKPASEIRRSIESAIAAFL